MVHCSLNSMKLSPKHHHAISLLVGRLFILASFSLVTKTCAFGVPNVVRTSTPFRRDAQERTTTKTTETTTRLWAGKKRALRKELADLGSSDVEDGSPVTSTTTTKKKRSSSSVSRKGRKASSKSGGGGSVSPALAQWAASSSSAPSDAPPDATSDASVEDEKSSAASYAPFAADDKRSGRRRRQSERRTAEEARRSEIRRVADALIDIAEEDDRDLDALLDCVRELASLDDGDADRSVAVGSALKIVCGSNRRANYRMVWAGSDDAICHVGTGLHNVPLARLQEVFVTIGKNRMEMYEVVSILGPFPNVKNVLRGDVSSSRSDGNALLRIRFDSMVDGTGKEILAGKEENVRSVDLGCVFASEDVIVCRTLLGEDDNKNRFWNENGSDLLIFVYEEDMDVKLEKLRVA